VFCGVIFWGRCSDVGLQIGGRGRERLQYIQRWGIAQQAHIRRQEGLGDCRPDRLKEGFMYHERFYRVARRRVVDLNQKEEK